MLMDLFWPGSIPDAARNSLNVAIHGMRRALRTATDRPVVVFRGNAYALDLTVCLWLDVDEFGGHLERARALELAGLREPAMREYEMADELYRGEFLADNPYETGLSYCANDYASPTSTPWTVSVLSASTWAAMPRPRVCVYGSSRVTPAGSRPTGG
jgi:hypothetical protein